MKGRDAVCYQYGELGNVAPLDTGNGGSCLGPHTSPALRFRVPSSKPSVFPLPPGANQGRRAMEGVGWGGVAPPAWPEA